MIAELALAADLAAWREVTDLRLSPDGQTVFYVSDISGALEAWKTPGLRLSNLNEQVTDLDLSADGKRFVFVSDYGGDERGDVFLDGFNVTKSTRGEVMPSFSPDGKRLAYLADPVQPFLKQLFVREADGTERQLTFWSTRLMHISGFQDGRPVWSPDGKTIAVTRSGDDYSGELVLADADGAGARLISGGGITIPQAFSPDGKLLACRKRNERGFLQPYVFDMAAEKGRFFGFDEWDVDQIAWHPKAGLFFTRNEGGSSGLYRMDSPDGQPRQVLPAQGHVDGFDLDAEGRTLAYIWSDSTHAPDVWLMDLATGKKRPVTRSITGKIRPEKLPKGRMISYPSFDGRMVSALYIPPAHKKLGVPPPVVVDVHGGPDWEYVDEFNALRQTLAGAGFAVLAPNFRGSTGHGGEWLALNRKDWGGGDRRDLIEGVKYLASRGEADPKRAGITGGSYGGYMTLYALARNEGEWAAGAAAYGMPDLILDYELSKDRFADWYAVQMGTDTALYKERSAITYLDKLDKPLLIIQGANDTNVPLAEAELVYNELKKRGRDVELVVYKDEGHGFTKRPNLIDYYARLAAFFKRALR